MVMVGSSNFPKFYSIKLPDSLLYTASSVSTTTSLKGSKSGSTGSSNIVCLSHPELSAIYLVD